MKKNGSKNQISVNGDTSGKYRDSMELSEMYVPDYSFVGVSKKSPVVVKDVDGTKKDGT